MADAARRKALLILAALAGLAFLAGCGGSSSTPAPSANSAPRAPAQWKFVHLFLKGSKYDGYLCDDFGSDNNCLGDYSQASGHVGPPNDVQGRGSARWLAPGDLKLHLGLFKDDNYLSGWMPGGNSDRWCINSGHLPKLFGDDNVVSGCDPSKQPSTEPVESSKGAPLYIGVKSYDNGFPLYTHLGYYFDIRGWVRSASYEAPRPPASTPGQSPPAAASGFGPDSIAEEFIDLAKDKAKNFILDKLGLDESSADLKRFEAKLDAIDAHLTRVENELKAAIAGLNFNVEILNANTKIEGLQPTFDKYIKGLLTDVINVKKAKEAGDKAKVDAAMAQYNEDKTTFAHLNLTDGAAKAPNALHLVFQPGSSADGLVTSLGLKLLANKRYLTLQDSKRQDAVYTKYEEYQALAEWITSEWDIARGHPEQVDDNVKQFLAFSKDQRDPKLENGLPPDLPDNVVIDRGPVATSSSLNKPMFASVDKHAAFWQQTSIRDSNWVPNIVQTANSAKLRGFSDWNAPDQQQVQSLIAERASGKSIVDHLKALGLAVTGDRFQDAIWTRDTAQRSVSFGQRSYPYTVHEAISLADGHEGERPDLRLRPYTGPYNFFSEVDFSVREQKGQVLLVRSTGDTRYF